MRNVARMISNRLLIRSFSIIVIAFVVTYLSMSTTYADVDYLREDAYDIPQERLPLQLLLDVTDDGLGDGEVSRIQLTLFENGTREKIMNVSYIISVTDILDEKDILVDLFYAQNGTVTLILAHTDGGGVIENGYREQFLNAWIADASDKPHVLVFRNPLIQENRLYELDIALLTVDDVRNVFALETIPRVGYVVDTSKDISTKFTIVPEFPASLLIFVVGICVAIIGRTLFPRNSNRLL